MAGNQSLPGILCQQEAPLNVYDGTAALTNTPAPTGIEEVSYEIGATYAPVSTSLPGLSPAEMQVLAWLREHRAVIVAGEQRFRVDRRAIAGAIAWEMLENVVRNPKTKLSVGVGKVHTFYGNWSALHKTGGSLFKGLLSGDRGEDTIAKEVEEFGYLPPQSYEGRVALLSTVEGGVAYIAAIMSAVADLASQHGFDDIRSDPVILTNVYQGRTLRSWDALLSRKPAGTRFKGGNPMDIWVAAHLAFLVDGVGHPNLPESGSVPPMPAATASFDPGFTPGAKTVVVAKNSSLSEIAFQQYGSHELWPLVYDLNKAKIGRNPNLVAAGITLSIAPLSAFTPQQLAWARNQSPTWHRFR